jgi:xylan 1,4-beta-xylosidase
MFAKMGGDRVAAESSDEVPLDAMLADGVRGAPDVAAFASRGPKGLAIMLWHYHDDDVPGPDADVDLAVAGLPPALREATVAHYRVDEHHGNAYAAWKRMGAPIAPNRDQYSALEAASELARLEAPAPVRVEAGTVRLRFVLPRQAVSLVTVDW